MRRKGKFEEGQRLLNVNNMKKTIIAALLLFSLGASEAWAGKPFKRVDETSVFVPKGQWLAGGDISYSEHTHDDYKFIIIKHWDGSGYNLNVSAFGGYAFKDDMLAGLRFSYSRSYINIDNLNLNLNSDLSFTIDNCYMVDHLYSGTAFLRNYLSLFGSRRFGIFNETQLTFGGGQGKMVNGTGENLEGTYQKTFKMSLGIAPGITTFITDNMAFEVSVGVLGFQSTWIKQVTNQVYKASRHTSSAKFKIDIFSIKLGMSVYFSGLPNLSNLSKPFKLKFRKKSDESEIQH